MKKPKFVIVDYDRYGNERIYFRPPGKRKIRLRGPLFSEEFFEDLGLAKKGDLKPAERQRGRIEAPPAGTFNRLCVDYYQSAEFRSLDPDSRYRRRLVLEPLREKFADFPAAKLEAKHIRKMRDGRAEKPHSANALIKGLRQLYKFGVEYGYVKLNPAREVSTLKGSVEGYHTWSPEELDRYREKFPTGTQQRLAFDLMLYTGVRRSDACKLGRQHVKDGRLVFTPEKTKALKGKRLSIPIHPDLLASILATPTGDLSFLTTARGRPWGSAASFGNVFKEWCRAAGLPNCSAHGLRKAATVKLIEAGCSTAQAAAITGHDSLKVLEHYARARDQERLADDAMAKLAGEDFRSKVPLDNLVADRGTIRSPNPLKRKGLRCELAPLRECVSNFMSGAKGGLSSALTGDRSLKTQKNIDKSMFCKVCICFRFW